MLPPTPCSTTPLMLMPHNMADTPSISVTLCPMCKHTSNYSTIGLHTVYIIINTNMHIYTLITMHCNDSGQCQHDMWLVTSQQMQKLKRSNNHHKHCKNWLRQRPRQQCTWCGCPGVSGVSVGLKKACNCVFSYNIQRCVSVRVLHCRAGTRWEQQLHYRGMAAGSR